MDVAPESASAAGEMETGFACTDAFSVSAEIKAGCAGNMHVDIWLDCKSCKHREGGTVMDWGTGTDFEEQCVSVTGILDLVYGNNVSSKTT